MSEEHRSNHHRGGSLKLCLVIFNFDLVDGAFFGDISRIFTQGQWKTAVETSFVFL
jgi:hypothetical protein